MLERLPGVLSLPSVLIHSLPAESEIVADRLSDHMRRNTAVAAVDTASQLLLPPQVARDGGSAGGTWLDDRLHLHYLRAAADVPEDSASEAVHSDPEKTTNLPPAPA